MNEEMVLQHKLVKQEKDLTIYAIENYIERLIKQVNEAQMGDKLWQMGFDFACKQILTKINIMR